MWRGADGEAYNLHDLKIADFGLSRLLHRPKSSSFNNWPQLRQGNHAHFSCCMRADEERNVLF
eukprot:1811186-Amphidinium_carterae.1